MADYHTTYRGPTGQTTQWEDIQAKLGNLPAKPKKEKPPAFEPEKDVVKDKTWLLQRNEDELSGDEDEFADDRVLESIRRQRLKELQQESQQPIQAHLDFIRSSDFRQCVTEASAAKWVVVVLYKDGHEGCDVLLDCMSKLAPRHPQSKFLKIISTDCIPNLPEESLPTVLVYHEKRCQKTFAGLSVWGGKRASEEYAVLVLNEIGPICRAADEDEEVAMDRDAHRLVRRVIMQREEQDEDSDFD